MHSPNALTELNLALARLIVGQMETSFRSFLSLPEGTV